MARHTIETAHVPADVTKMILKAIIRNLDNGMDFVPAVQEVIDAWDAVSARQAVRLGDPMAEKIGRMWVRAVANDLADQTLADMASAA